jgi:ADP-heptose:LPS heptosyltransferase
MKFLIIQFYQIGDVVLTTHIPRMIRTRWPDSRIDFLSDKVNEPLLRHHPHISKVIPFRRKSGILSFLRLLKTIRSSRYDVVLDFQDTPRSTYVTLFSGAPHRVTYEGTSRKPCYTTLVPSAEKGSYPTVFKSSLLTPFIPNLDIYAPPPPKPEIYVPEACERHIEGLFQQFHICRQDFIVTMAPTHRRPTKRWPLRHFYDAARYLMDRYNAKIILSWGPGEQDYILAHEGFRNAEHVNLFANWRLDLLQLAALMRKTKMHIGNDSAPMHIATSQGLPTFTVFGSTSRGWSYPEKEHASVIKPLACRPCRGRTCRFGEAMPCLEALTFADIKDRLDEFIQQVILR